MEIIELNLNKKAILEKLPIQPGDVRKTCADISKAKQLLDYEPTTDIRLGVAKFVKWYMSEKAG